MRGEGTKLGEGERAFRDYYVRDYYANPDSGILRSGIVHGAENCSSPELIEFITEESFLQHVNITINSIKNGLINLIKVESYVQYSLLIGLALTLINIYRFVLSTKYRLRYLRFDQRQSVNVNAA